jgi:hypothetical protein
VSVGVGCERVVVRSPGLPALRGYPKVRRCLGVPLGERRRDRAGDPHRERDARANSEGSAPPPRGRGQRLQVTRPRASLPLHRGQLGVDFPQHRVSGDEHSVYRGLTRVWSGLPH